mgnify:CR=1 FL=1
MGSVLKRVVRPVRSPLFWLLIMAPLIVGIASISSGQFGQRGRRNQTVLPDGTIVDRQGVPEWTLEDEFKGDVFTFARVRYESGGRGREKWKTDFPDSDLNFSFRLQQLTSIKVDPNPVIVTLDDPRIFEYPFLYMIEPGDMLELTQEEIEGLRLYCFNGGFMMVDDFWGEWEYQTFYEQIKRVFPEREPQELPLDHEIFHCVYDLPIKPQVPSINQAVGGRAYGITWERPDAEEVHYRAILDDENRIMVLICHNTDLGDGWEREGVDEWYFHEFSEKLAYPMGINIVTYAMTH